ncbi:hypothetical protein ACUUL3_02155 [Thiovibrio sp. JS02]
MATRPSCRFGPMLFGLLLLLSACDTRPAFRYDFERANDLDNLEWKCGVVYNISTQHASQGEKSLAITLYPPPAGDGRIYRGVIFSNFNADWRDAKLLQFEMYNPQPDPIELTLRIDDKIEAPYEDRFNKALLLAPGPTRVEIPLETLLTSGSGRKLDRGKIQHVSLFAVRPRGRYLLYLDNVRLTASRENAPAAK